MPSETTTKVPVAVPGKGKETLVSGPLTMWAQPITVMLQSTDLSLYGDVSTSSTATLTPAVSALQPTLTHYDYNPTVPTDLAPNPPLTAATITGTLMTPTISTAAIEPTNPTDLTEPDAHETTALSSSAKAGIGIGAAALGLAVFVIAIASRVFRRRRKRRQSEPAPQATPRRLGSSRSFKPWAKVKEVRRGPPAELEA